MSETEIELALVNGIRRVMAYGQSACPNLSADTKPIGGIPDFDSLIGVEVCVEVEVATGLRIPDDLFFDKRGRSLTIRAAAQRILEENRGSHTAGGGAG